MKLVEQPRCRAKADTAPKGLSYENHIDWMAADRIKALEEVLHEARFVLEPFADIKPRLWKTDMEKAIRALKSIDEVLK